MKTAALPTLHPDRLREMIRTLKGAVDHELDPDESETCLAALELVRKGQLAIGLSANTVDTVSSGVKLLKAVAEVTGKLKGNRS